MQSKMSNRGLDFATAYRQWWASRNELNILERDFKQQNNGQLFYQSKAKHFSKGLRLSHFQQLRSVQRTGGKVNII